MMKNYGVCLCLVALGLVGIGAPAGRAAEREAGEAVAASETAVSAASTTSTASAATESNAVDLRQRIEALKAELADLDTQLAASETPAAPAGAPSQDQGSAPAPAQAPAGGAAPAATTPPAPMPLSSPSMSGPLATAVPHEISAGPFGKLEVTGILSGIGMAEDNHVIPGDSQMHADVSNAQVFVQKTTGWFQFYLQGGAYNIPALGTAFLQDGPTITGLYGPFPQGYAKLVKGNFNVEIGALPTLIGAEYTFTFENMNVERGLLWNQENAVNRGIQLNETYKKATIAFSWNDGFYSNRYNWLTGSLAWALNSANTLSFVGGGPFSANGRSLNTAPVLATPGLQNNSMIFNLIYTYTHGNWIISPYYQYTGVKRNASINITSGSHTNGGALLLDYAFKHGFSMAVRPEYIKSSTGNVLDTSSNLMFGPGTGGFSFTATPTYIKDGFFLRGDISVVHVTNFNTTSGFAFGTDGTKLNQVRGVIETGFMF